MRRLARREVTQQCGEPEVGPARDAAQEGVDAPRGDDGARGGGVNPVGWYLRDGLTGLPPETRPEFRLPVIPGTDVSDAVEAGAYAEYATAPPSDLARKPAGLTHERAARGRLRGEIVLTVCPEQG
ncbi:hypothetical protein [Streptomyces alkaliterrae]|uniref:hypothetical protein n=1 Tax=Streptomyces alkaliterrae TaxID=2213162 RepID=UPI003F68F721